MDGESAKGVREHFGKGRLALEPSRTVFINCPFDEDYAQTLDAIVFAVACCGFIPRSALESGDIAVPGFDPERYDGGPESVIPPVVGWLATRLTTVKTPKPNQVLAELPRFLEEKTRLQAEWGGRAPWADIVLLALEAAARL